MTTSDDSGQGSSGGDWVKDTNLFRKWQEVRKEIDAHKWYESEKAGHDIGWDRATIDWMLHHGGDAPKDHND